VVGDGYPPPPKAPAENGTLLPSGAEAVTAAVTPAAQTLMIRPIQYSDLPSFERRPIMPLASSVAIPCCSQSSPSGPATITRPSHGAQERLVPARKGSIPEAPGGEHSSQFGTLLDATPVALPDDPAGLAEEAARDALDRDALDGVLALPPPDAAPVGAVPGVGPAAVVPVAVDDVD